MNWVRHFLLRTIFSVVFITTFVFYNKLVVAAALECEISTPPIKTRIQNRDYPSVFMAWYHIQNLPLTITPDERIPYHDLVWDASYGTQYFSLSNELIDPENNFHFEKLKTLQMLAANPNLIFVVTLPLRYVSEDNYLLQEHLQADDFPWQRDTDGNRVLDTVPGGAGDWVDFTLPKAQEMFPHLAKGLKDCGYDGIFIDFWQEDRDPILRQGQVDILKKIRAAVGDDFLIIANTNDQINPSSAPYINGLMMETYRALSDNYSHAGMIGLEETLLWAAENLQEPVVNCLEGEGIGEESPMSPANLQGMRLITTLSLTHSNGYVLYTMGVQHGEPHTHDADYSGPHYNPETGDPRAEAHAEDHDTLFHHHHHEHYWYDFWNADLGKPIGEIGELYQTPNGVAIDGLFIREFTNGWAVYNRSGREQMIQLPEKVSGFASGIENRRSHTLRDLDGEIYLKPVEVQNPADLNGDGVVNILDLVIVANGLGSDAPDLNGDGSVNILDLVIVANAFE
ncbi:MAG: dockerin type I domain-containing protein [Candidatus Poribacteria bacterium]|nr:dockerin type I domain-containing protein [Candidatus Poribacteria bacterium]